MKQRSERQKHKRVTATRLTSVAAVQEKAREIKMRYTCLREVHGYFSIIPQESVSRIGMTVMIRRKQTANDSRVSPYIDAKIIRAAVHRKHKRLSFMHKRGFGADGDVRVCLIS